MRKGTVYQSQARRTEGDCDAVVLHCSDHRFQASFREFLAEALRLRSYSLLAIPGGGHVLSAETFLPKFAKTGLQSLSFLVKRGKPHRIILIGHDDCLFFRERLQFFFVEAALNDKQFANLRNARAAVLERFPEIAVEVYFADAAADGAIRFELI